MSLLCWSRLHPTQRRVAVALVLCCMASAVVSTAAFPPTSKMAEESTMSSAEMTCHASEQKTKFQLTATREQAAQQAAQDKELRKHMEQEAAQQVAALRKQAEQDKEEMRKQLEAVQRELEKARGNTTIAQYLRRTTPSPPQLSAEERLQICRNGGITEDCGILATGSAVVCWDGSTPPSSGGSAQGFLGGDLWLWQTITSERRITPQGAVAGDAHCGIQVSDQGLACWGQGAPVLPTGGEVVATVGLHGINTVQFSTAAQIAFKEVVASYVSLCGSNGATQCTSSDVTIVSASGSNLLVEFSLTSTSSATAAAAVTALSTAITTNAVQFKNDLNAKGGVLSSVLSVYTLSAPVPFTGDLSQGWEDVSLSADGAACGVLAADKSGHCWGSGSMPSVKVPTEGDVGATVELAGISYWSTNTRTAFKEVVASYVSLCGSNGATQCTSSDVVILSSSDQEGLPVDPLTVAFQLTLTSSATAAAAITALTTAIVTNVAQFQTDLNAKPAPLSSVSGVTARLHPQLDTSEGWQTIDVTQDLACGTTIADKGAACWGTPTGCANGACDVPTGGEVDASVTLTGISSFSAASQTAFKEVIATYLSLCGSDGTTQCTSSDVKIMSSGSGNPMPVSFQVATSSYTTGATGATTLQTAITTNAAQFKADLIAKGGDLASISAVATTSAPVHSGVDTRQGWTAITVGYTWMTAAYSFACGIAKATSQAACWGCPSGSPGLCNVPTGMVHCSRGATTQCDASQGFLAISASKQLPLATSGAPERVCAVLVDKKGAVCWSSNGVYTTNMPTDSETSQGYQAIAVSKDQVCATLVSNGAAKCWSLSGSTVPLMPTGGEVRATVSLAGVSSNYWPYQRDGFQQVVASYVSLCGSDGATQCTSSDVAILSTSGSDPYTVQFEVITSSSTTADPAATALSTAITTNAAQFVSDLNANQGTPTSATTLSAPARVYNAAMGQAIADGYKVSCPMAFPSDTPILSVTADSTGRGATTLAVHSVVPVVVLYSAADFGTAQILWGNPSQAITMAYEVQVYDPDSDTWSTVATATHPQVSATISRLSPNTAVQVKVKGTSGDGSVVFSPAATFTTLPVLTTPQLSAYRNTALSVSQDKGIAVNISLTPGSSNAVISYIECFTNPLTSGGIARVRNRIDLPAGSLYSMQLEGQATPCPPPCSPEYLPRYEVVNVTCEARNDGGTETGSQASASVRTQPDEPSQIDAGQITIDAATATSFVAQWIRGIMGGSTNIAEEFYTATLWLNGVVVQTIVVPGVAAGVQTSCTFENLNPKTQYGVTITAHNIAGAGPPSIINEASTVSSVPDAPAIPTVTATTASSVTLGWVPPASNGENIKSYTLRYSKVAAATWLPLPDIEGATTYTVSPTNDPLEPNVEYMFQVAAVNGIGRSAFSSIVNASTLPRVPSSPGTPNAVPDGESSLRVQWDTCGSGNACTGGLPVTGYEVRIDPNCDGSFSGETRRVDGSPLVWDNLTVSVYYCFTVAAMNALGTGEPSGSSLSTRLTAAVIEKSIAFSATLAIPMESWAANKDAVKADIAAKLSVVPSKVKITGVRSGSTIVDFEVTVDDVSVASQAVNTMVAAAEAGTLSIGNVTATTMSPAVELSSNGIVMDIPDTNAFNPSGGTTVTVKLQQDSVSDLGSVRCQVDGAIVPTIVLDYAAYQIACVIPAVASSSTTSVRLAMVNGANSVVLYAIPPAGALTDVVPALQQPGTTSTPVQMSTNRALQAFLNKGLNTTAGTSRGEPLVYRSAMLCCFGDISNGCASGALSSASPDVSYVSCTATQHSPATVPVSLSLDNGDTWITWTTGSFVYTCSADQYLTGTTCNDCTDAIVGGAIDGMSGATCDGTGDVKPNKGYWTPSQHSLNVYKCKMASYCLGETAQRQNNTCKQGHKGPICQQCEDGYSLTAEGCVSCGNRTASANELIIIVIFVLFVLGCVGVAAVSWWNKKVKGATEEENREFEDEQDLYDSAELEMQNAAQQMGGTPSLSQTRRSKTAAKKDLAQIKARVEKECGIELKNVPNPPTSAATVSQVSSGKQYAKTLLSTWAKMQDRVRNSMNKAKTFTSHSQIVTEFSRVYDSVTWPKELLSYLDVFAVVNLDFISGLSLECMADGQWNFYMTFQATLIFPMVVLVLQSLLWLLRRQISQTQRDLERIDTQNWKFMLLFLFLIYPYTASTTLKIYRCDEVEGVSYLAVDYDLRCDTAEWSTNAGLAGVSCLLYIVGIPAFFYVVLHINRADLHPPEDARADRTQHEIVAKRFGFLYDAYEPHLWWWEIVVLSQKLLLTGLIIFIKPDTATQLAAGFMISIVYLVLHVQYQPLKDDDEDRLQFLSMLTILLTLFGGVLLKMDVDDEDPYGAVLMRIILLGVNVSVALLFLYECCQGLGTTSPRALRELAHNIAKHVLNYVRVKVVKFMEAVCDQLGVDLACVQRGLKMLDEAEERLIVFTEHCTDPYEFICRLDEVTSAEDAINAADTMWLVLIEIVGHETVEQYTAELAEAIGKGVKLSLEDAGASETTQIVAATVVEAGVSFTVLNGLRATMDEGEAFMTATGVRDGNGLSQVDVAKLEAEMNRLLAVFCTPEVTARVTLRMVPIVRGMIQDHDYILEELMEPAHFQLTLFMLDEIERVTSEERDAPKVQQDSQALCRQLVTCRGLTDMPALVNTIFQLACTILGEKHVKTMYQGVLRALGTEAREMSALSWMSDDTAEPPAIPAHTEAPTEEEPVMDDGVAIDLRTDAPEHKDAAGSLSEKDRQILHGLFERYDLDSSGTLNTDSELQQITMNAIFTLGLKVVPSDAEAKVADLKGEGGVSQSPLDFEQFLSWFTAAFVTAQPRTVTKDAGSGVDAV